MVASTSNNKATPMVELSAGIRVDHMLANGIGIHGVIALEHIRYFDVAGGFTVGLTDEQFQTLEDAYFTGIRVGGGISF